MTNKAQHTAAEKIAGFRPFEIDVVIPLGPLVKDRQKMGSLAPFIPKPLALIGTRPMLWHILKQISGIESHVNTVHLLVQKHRGTNDWLIIKDYLEYMADLLPMHQKFNVRINEGEMLCDVISQLEFKSHHFLMHFDDILLPNVGGFFEELIHFHLQEEKKNSIIGTLAYSRWYPLEIGLIKQSHQEKRMYSLEEKSPTALGQLLHRVGPTIEEVCINMAVSVFNAKINQYLEGKDSNFYKNIAELKGVQFGLYEHRGEWYHVDTIHELTEQHVKNFKRWVD